MLPLTYSISFASNFHLYSFRLEHNLKTLCSLFSSPYAEENILALKSQPLGSFGIHAVWYFISHELFYKGIMSFVMLKKTFWLLSLSLWVIGVVSMLSGILFLMGCSIIIIMLYCTDISNSYPCLILVSWGPLCFLLPIHLPP